MSALFASSAGLADDTSAVANSEPPPVVVSAEITQTPEAPLEDVWPALSAARFGDLDAMVDRGEIRVLTTFTLGSYFIDRGQQRGTVYEMSQILEKYVRDKLVKKGRLLQVTIIPVRRDQLLPFLNTGHGDIAFANLTITPERSKVVEFSIPFTTKFRELLVTGPSAPEITEVVDLAGKEVVVPRASSYYESISELNEKFVRDGLEPIKVTMSDPRLEAEDILEMMSAGLLPTTVVDEHRVRVWAKVFKNLSVHEDIVLRENSAIALAMRKGSPQLKEMLDGYVHENRVGTLMAWRYRFCESHGDTEAQQGRRFFHSFYDKVPGTAGDGSQRSRDHKDSRSCRQGSRCTHSIQLLRKY